MAESATAELDLAAASTAVAGSTQVSFSRVFDPAVALTGELVQAQTMLDAGVDGDLDLGDLQSCVTRALELVGEVERRRSVRRF